MKTKRTTNFNQLALEIKGIGKKLGFSRIGITDLKLDHASGHFKEWLKSNHHGQMGYFEKHAELYAHPQKLLADATSIICCRINYPQSASPHHPLASFAQLRDYSSYIRQLLKVYIEKIGEITTLPLKTRIFAGNGPVLEKALAAKAGLGWYGKNSLLVSEDAGSFFFLGEILINLPLPIDQPVTNRCGNCTKCMDSCPTKAIIAPHKIDAKRCIAYLTIDNKGEIPLELRQLIGNKIFGCDLCQTVCPWNKSSNTNTSFNNLQIPQLAKQPDLVEWSHWDEKTFREQTKGSPIERISYDCWLRNLKVALANGVIE